MLKKAVSLSLCALILGGVVSGASSCSGGGNGGTVSGGTTASATTVVSESLRANTPDTLPSGLDFKGEKVTVFCRSDSPWLEEIYAENLNGEVVNDAVYNRNHSVEERLNIKLNVVSQPGIHGNETSFNDKIRSSILSADGAYDLIAGYAFFITPLGVEGLFVNLKNVKYLDFSQPWWTQSLADELEVDGKLFFMAGDLALSMIKSLFAVYFNQRIQSEWKIDSLYQTVLDGGWTLDKMQELSTLVLKDLNGDSTYDKNDMYGTGITTGNYIDAMLAAFDQPVTQKNSEGLPELALNTPKMVQMVEKTYSFLYESKGVYAVPENTENEDNMIKMFTGGQLLFMTSTLNSTEKLRDMSDGYGIIPYPKWTEDQKNYHTAAQDAYSLFCIPKTVKDSDMIGAVSEALAAESYRSVTPAFYDIALKGKYIRDDESSKMLDLIRGGVVFNFGFVNSSSIDWISHLYRDLMTTKSKDFASSYKTKESSYTTKLAALVDAYKALS